ncbi:MAG: hypothetical protein RR012_01215 [Oscillospiraceae bacterium]
MTELQKQMSSAEGHNVEINVVGGYKPCIGKCTAFTQPLDNEPEVAAISVQVEGYNGLYEITEDEIETLKIID